MEHGTLRILSFDVRFADIHRWNQTMGDLHGKAVRMAIPPDLHDLIDKHQEAYNSPTYGPQHNIFHSSLQVNIASPAPPGQQANLVKHLGVAGGSHIDENDDPIIPSVMTCTSNLRDGVHPGLFHMLDLGIYVVLERTTTVVFSGRHRHGGTAPYVPADMGPCETDVQMTWISYPNQPTMDRTGPCMVAAAGFNSKSVEKQVNTLFTPPRMDVGRLDAHSTPSEDTRCFTLQGRYCMDDRTLELFLEREMLNLRVAVRAQANFKTDQPHLRSSIGLYSDGSKMPGLVHGPGGDEMLRQELEKQLLITRLRMAYTVPLMYRARVQSRKVDGLPTYLLPELAANSVAILGGPWSKPITDPAALEYLAKVASKTKGEFKTSITSIGYPVPDGEPTIRGGDGLVRSRSAHPRWGFVVVVVVTWSNSVFQEVASSSSRSTAQDSQRCEDIGRSTWTLKAVHLSSQECNHRTCCRF